MNIRFDRKKYILSEIDVELLDKSIIEVANNIIKELDVPSSLIGVNVPLSLYGFDSNRNIDLIIYKIKNNVLVPCAIIQIIEKDIEITDELFEEVGTGLEDLGCEYLILSDGERCECGKFFIEYESYIYINEVPKYNKMIK